MLKVCSWPTRYTTFFVLHGTKCIPCILNGTIFVLDETSNAPSSYVSCSWKGIYWIVSQSTLPSQPPTHSVDYRLPHQQVTEGVGEPHPVRHPPHLHWLSARLCPHTSSSSTQMTADPPQPNCNFVKFADDTVQHHSSALQDFAAWKLLSLTST